MQPITINGRPMRIMWGSNSPLTAGGYGVTTALVVPRLRDRLGIDVAVSATYGHYGRKIVWQGIDIYPPGNKPFGNDIHAANSRQHKADLLLTHQDVWTQFPDQITAGGTRWASWQPLDSEPVAPTIVERLRDYCYQPIALARFGQQQAELAGIPMPLVLQGIDTNVFIPGDRSAARKALGWPQDAFIVGMVARNSGYPNRKAYPQQIEAFAQFAKQHRDAMLYLHAELNMDADDQATPLGWQIERHGLEGRVIVANSYDLNMGYATESMVMRYQAMDTLLCVSMSEGFGIPLIEAQSCGIPVISGDWTAMAENCYAGWKVAKEDSEPWPVSPLACFWRLPHIGAITEQLEKAYSTLQDAHTRAILAIGARDCAVQYHDQDMLIDTQWRSVLSDLAARIEAEPTPWHVHRWAGVGYQTPAGIVQACVQGDCPAERLNGQTADQGFPLDVAGITLDIQDDPAGGVRRAIASEIEHVYRLQTLDFQPGDVILDIGAHVGVVSCYLGKRWPGTTIYSFEPTPSNFARFARNLDANGVRNAEAFDKAVTADGRDLELHGDHTANTGGYSAFSCGPDTEDAPSVALNTFLQDADITHIALLKLDCEGCEYEILSTFPWSRVTVDRLIMEVHENSHTRAAFGSGARLIAAMEDRIAHVTASLITIPDPVGITQEELLCQPS